MPDNSSPSVEARECFSRSIDLLGEEAFEKLARARVAVFGLGGVGSHTAVALARTGVGTIRLVDIDPLTASSLNRHACATMADIGAPKVEVVGRYLKAINPRIVLDDRQAFFHTDTASELLAGELDLVVDAIDSQGPKIALLTHCLTQGIPVVSSMGASSRTDPTKLRTGDIGLTEVCPLARNVRRALRRAGWRGGVQVVYSVEPPGPTFPPDDEPHYDRGRRRRRLPSLAVMPGIFGYTLAKLAIDALVNDAPR
jgi:tRNA A37 threonylcarbamoyladenosine dehydratase